jgi:TM2 domain-containing membrane protein YozV
MSTEQDQGGGLAPYHYQPPMPAVVPKSPGAALALGLFFPGVGNMYAGRPGKGVLVLACTVIAWLSIIVFVGFLLVPACHIWGAWTGNNDANRWNRSHGLIS